MARGHRERGQPSFDPLHFVSLDRAFSPILWGSPQKSEGSPQNSGVTGFPLRLSCIDCQPVGPWLVARLLRRPLCSSLRQAGPFEKGRGGLTLSKGVVDFPKPAGLNAMGLSWPVYLWLTTVIALDPHHIMTVSKYGHPKRGDGP